jgi:hypothetical protein
MAQFTIKLFKKEKYNMAKQNNRKCICCATEYRYCNTCSEDKSKPAWYAIYCSENCKKLFQAVSGYLANAVNIEETKARFDNCDLSYKNKLKDKFIEVIDEVCKNKIEKIEVETTIVEETVIENVEEVIETVETSNAENIETESIKIVPKSRNGKINKRR